MLYNYIYQPSKLEAYLHTKIYSSYRSVNVLKSLYKGQSELHKNS